LFQKCVLALNGQVDQDDVELYEIFTDTWKTFQHAIEQTPNYALLKNELEQSIDAWIKSFEYSLWLENTSRIDEKWESHLDIIAPSGTTHLAGLIDLLFIPNISAEQVSIASEVFLLTQKQVQIANWITTWQREFGQGDFSSGVFSMALENGWITPNDLQNGDIEIVRQKIQNSPIENRLWAEWERLKFESEKIVKDKKLHILDGYVDSFSAITFMQLASIKKT
jgi:hypothetical protein